MECEGAWSDENVLHLDCGRGFHRFFTFVGLTELYILNMCNLLYLNYTQVVSKKKKNKAKKLF